MRSTSFLPVVLLGVLGAAGCRRPVKPLAGEAGALLAPPSPFTCGAKPACPADAPRGGAERALVDAIRAAAAGGDVDRAAALVACARDEGRVRLEADPGFAEVVPSRDGKLLFGHLPLEGVLRVFDAGTWVETMHLDDVGKVKSSRGGLALVTGLTSKPRSAIWDLAAERLLPLAVPPGAAGGVSDGGTYLFWLEARALVLVAASAPDDVVRVPLEATDLELRELPRGLLLASTASGRHWVIDPAAPRVVRTFAGPQSTVARLALADRSLALVDVGQYIQGYADAIFGPSHAPLAVSLTGSEAPVPLAGRACPRSRIVAVSDDGDLAIARASEAWCLFDVKRRALAATLPAKMFGFGGSHTAVQGAFVGPDVAVVGIGGELERLRVVRGNDPALVDLGPFAGASILLEPSEGWLVDGFGGNPPLVAVPRERVWVGQGANRSLSEIHPDGTSSDRVLPFELSPMAGANAPRVDPRRERVIGGVHEPVRSCLLAAPWTCVELPLGGPFRVAPDGEMGGRAAAIGVVAVGLGQALGGRGAVVAVDVPSGRELFRHRAPGIQALALPSETELVVLGEDGLFMSCALDAKTCRVAGLFPGAAFVPSEPGTVIASGGETLRAIPDLPPGIRLELLRPRPRLDRLTALDLLVSRRKILVRAGSGRITLVDATSGATLHELAIEGYPQLAAAGAAPRIAVVADTELLVLDLDRREKVWSKRLPPLLVGPPAATALSDDGAIVAVARGGALTVFDVATGGERGRWPISAVYASTIGLSPDGRWVAAVSDTGGGPAGAAKGALREATLVIGDRKAPANAERIDLGRVTERGDYGATTVSVTNSGAVAVAFAEGRAFLAGADRNLRELSRDASDEGLWLTAKDGTVSSVGKVFAKSRGLSCRIGSRVVPREACIPSFCGR